MEKMIDRTKIRSILLVSLANLGDIVLTTPVLDKLIFEFPGAAIDVMCGPAGEEVFAKNPRVREVIINRKHLPIAERMKLTAYLRRKKYDMAIDLKNTALPFLAGARYRTGIFKPKMPSRTHKMDEHLVALQCFGISGAGASFCVTASADDKRLVDAMLSACKGKKVAVISPGSKSHLKRWSAEKFAELSDLLIKEHGCEVFVIGDAADKEVVKRMKTFARYPVQDLCCGTNIGMVYELMRQADIVVTNDSAPLHIASAANAPVVAIFGPSDEKKYGPVSESCAVVAPDRSCRPCCNALCKKGPAEGCIPDVTVEDVYKTAKELLGRACGENNHKNR